MTVAPKHKPRPKQRSRQPAPGRAGPRRPGGRRKGLIAMRKIDGVPRPMSDPMSAITAFWDASLHKVAPPLRTTFGNFATLNLVERFTVSTSITSEKLVWLPWTASPLSALIFPVVDATISTGTYQQLFKVLAQSTNMGSSLPKAVRPLRSSFRLTSLTKNINTASAAHVLSYDNAIATKATFTVGPQGDAFWPGDFVASLRDLVMDSPETKVYPLTKFTEPHTFVSVPCSWPDYNSYHNFAAFRHNINDGSNLACGDLWTLTNREDSAANTVYADAVAYPTLTAATTYQITAGFGEVPAMRGHLVFIPATPEVQLLEFEVFRQLGCRFSANTIGHSFHHTPAPSGPSTETNLLSSIQSVSSNASAAFKSVALDVSSGYSAISGVAKAIASDSSATMGILSNALRSLK